MVKLSVQWHGYRDSGKKTGPAARAVPEMALRPVVAAQVGNGAGYVFVRNFNELRDKPFFYNGPQWAKVKHV